MKPLQIDMEETTKTISSCPGCASAELSFFYEAKNIPAHSVLLMPTREEALGYPRGDIALAFCSICGLIFNALFDPDLHEYSSRYEETQGFSPTFNAFSQRLAEQLIERYGLRDRTIIEIGCGKGEFLNLLCTMGNNRGVGFDPAYVSDRMSGNERIAFIKDFYSEKYSDYIADFVCCKMTLEHIKPVAEFVATVRRSIGDNLSTTVFFQVPDTTRILSELAFWDIYYEHCSYFSPASLGRLFRRCGFDVIDLWRDYHDQYLMVGARPGDSLMTQEDELEELTREVEYFSENYMQKLMEWKRYLERINREGRRAVLWGAGSKGVSFLTTLDIQTEIEYAVDINPYKHGTYMAGTGQEIVAPAFLREYEPDSVIVMNPVYREEIRKSLDEMDVSAEIITV